MKYNDSFYNYDSIREAVYARSRLSAAVRKTMPTPMAIMGDSAQRSVSHSDSIPTTGGLASSPKYPMEATNDMAACGEALDLPARLKQRGTTEAMPNPVKAKPMVAIVSVGDRRASVSPAAMHAPLVCSTGTTL